MSDDKEPKKKVTKKLTPEEVQIFGNQLEWIVHFMIGVSYQDTIPARNYETPLRKSAHRTTRAECTLRNMRALRNSARPCADSRTTHH